MTDKFYAEVLEIDEETPITWVGCYVLRWGKDPEPSVMFRAIEGEEAKKLAVADRLYQLARDLAEGKRGLAYCVSSARSIIHDVEFDEKDSAYDD